MVDSRRGGTECSRVVCVVLSVSNGMTERLAVSLLTGLHWSIRDVRIMKGPSGSMVECFASQETACAIVNSKRDQLVAAKTGTDFPLTAAPASDQSSLFLPACSHRLSPLCPDKGHQVLPIPIIIL